MTIACHKAAKKVTMEYMEETRGKGWWGSESYKDYYENLENQSIVDLNNPPESIKP